MSQVTDIREVLFILAPEFETADSTELNRIDTIIGLAQKKVNARIFGEKYNEGVAWLTAHMLKRSALATSGLTGNVVKEKLADQEITYSDTSKITGIPNFYGSTIYGQEFWNLLKTLQATPFLWGSNSYV
jgi:hypothetical protein